MNRRRKYEVDDDGIEDTVDWEMTEEIGLANGMEIDYYEYWKHPSYKSEEETE